jgi:voltage-gated potassium channel
MSTLGFGDITFESDVGRAFSIVVLLSGTVFMLILLPFTFIQFFYAPWMEAQAAARAPRRLPAETKGHVVLTRYGPVDAAFVRRLQQYHYPYAILVPEVERGPAAARLGPCRDGRRAGRPRHLPPVRIEQAALVVTTHSDTVNTNVAFTVREISAKTPIVATALDAVSVDILELAGCNRVCSLPR